MAQNQQRRNRNANTEAIVRAGLPPTETEEEQEARKAEDAERVSGIVENADTAQQEELARIAEEEQQAAEQAEAEGEDATAERDEANSEELSKEMSEKMARAEAFTNRAVDTQSPSPVTQSQVIAERNTSRSGFGTVTRELNAAPAKGKKK